jgi:hypothetical protein
LVPGEGGLTPPRWGVTYFGNVKESKTLLIFLALRKKESKEFNNRHHHQHEANAASASNHRVDLGGGARGALSRRGVFVAPRSHCALLLIVVVWSYAHHMYCSNCIFILLELYLIFLIVDGFQLGYHNNDGWCSRRSEAIRSGDTVGTWGGGRTWEAILTDGGFSESFIIVVR